MQIDDVRFKVQERANPPRNVVLREWAYIVDWTRCAYHQIVKSLECRSCINLRADGLELSASLTEGLLFPPGLMGVSPPSRRQSVGGPIDRVAQVRAARVVRALGIYLRAI